MPDLLSIREIVILAFELFAAVQVQPRLVLERMVADLVPRRHDRTQGRVVARFDSIGADHEERDAQPLALEHIEHVRHHCVQVRRPRLPARVAVDLHVRPQVVEVERQPHLEFVAARRKFEGRAGRCDDECLLDFLLQAFPGGELHGFGVGERKEAARGE